MNQNWQDAIKRDIVRLGGDSTVEDVRKRLEEKSYALVEVEGQPLALITAEILADLPSGDALKRIASSLPPLMVVYQSPDLSTASLTQHARAVMLKHPNLAGIVVMDEKGAEVEGVLRRKDLIKWIAGRSGSNGRKGRDESPHSDAFLAGTPEPPLVKYVCPESDYFRYVISPPKESLFCPHHPKTRLLPEGS